MNDDYMYYLGTAGTFDIVAGSHGWLQIITERSSAIIDKYMCVSCNTHCNLPSICTVAGVFVGVSSGVIIFNISYHAWSSGTIDVSLGSIWINRSMIKTF